MSSMAKFMIRKEANVPTMVNLIDPATGELTEDWIKIRSSLSDEFFAARERVNQEVQSINEPDKAKRAEIVAELQLSLKMSLVHSWSFEEKMDEANLRQFLRESPQVQELVMRVADDQQRFFGKPSEPSSTGRLKK